MSSVASKLLVLAGLPPDHLEAVEETALGSVERLKEILEVVSDDEKPF